MHRDLKLENILINFPYLDFSDILATDKEERTGKLKERLRQIDLTKEEFLVKIADLGFARELNHEDLA